MQSGYEGTENPMYGALGRNQTKGTRGERQGKTHFTNLTTRTYMYMYVDFKTFLSFSGTLLYMCIYRYEMPVAIHKLHICRLHVSHQQNYVLYTYIFTVSQNIILVHVHVHSNACGTEGSIIYKSLSGF